MKLMITMPFLAIVCMCVGCAKDTSALPDKVPAKQPDLVREAIGLVPEVAVCSDGTIYVVGESSGKMLWLVNGKAVKITIDDEFYYGFFRPMYDFPICDFNGGIYVIGQNHLWYCKSGVATQVVLVSISEIPSDEHKVTAKSANWAALTTYGREQFYKGLEEGREEARCGNLGE